MRGATMRGSVLEHLGARASEGYVSSFIFVFFLRRKEPTGTYFDRVRQQVDRVTIPRRGVFLNER